MTRRTQESRPPASTARWRPVRVLWIIFAIAASALLALYGAWRMLECRWYAGIIPAGIGISRAIEISGQSGLREGCGVAVFRMDEATAERIGREGLGVLGAGMKSRDHDDAYHTFGEWHATPSALAPAAGESAALVGLQCSDADDTLVSDIVGSLRIPGSYFTVGDEKIILVVPVKRLVVLSYNG